MRRWFGLLVAAALVVGAAATASAQEADPPPGAEAAPRVVRTIGTPGSGDGQLFLPESVDLLADGTVLVGQGRSFVNGTPRFQRFQQDGTPLGTPSVPPPTRRWDHPLWDIDANGEFVPLDAAEAGIAANVEALSAYEVGPDGLLYVADGRSGGRDISVLTTSGTLVRTIGSGRLEDPNSIAFGPAGEVVVADRWRCKIFVFSATGTLLRKWAGCGALAVAPNGDVVATGSGGTVGVRRFRADGRLLEEYRLMTFTGGVAVDEQGRAYVVDPLAHNVKVIKPGDGVLVDARIRRGTGTLIGNGVYSTDGYPGNPQYPPLAVVRAGQTVTFTVSMQNDGLAADRLKITGTGSSARALVRYYRNGVDVTSKVVAGTYVTGPVPIDGTHDLTLVVAGDFSGRITVSSVTRPSAKDTVLAMVDTS